MKIMMILLTSSISSLALAATTPTAFPGCIDTNTIMQVMADSPTSLRVLAGTGEYEVMGQSCWNLQGARSIHFSSMSQQICPGDMIITELEQCPITGIQQY